ncbi:MAG: ABC transporter substrate-binding protein [Acidimicrobiaceae bacterium]|nr:ABC transporter substrate-binding protein [Acidimicrobiaceae bacterium]
MVRRSTLMVIAALLGLVAAACSSGSPKPSGQSSGNGGGTKSPITIGYITDQTGVASSTFADSPGGAKARVALQNAQGGVDGHPIKLISEDSQSSPSTNLTAAQQLVSQGALAIINYSSFAFGSYRYLQQQGVPVVGSAFDGPEWGEQPNSNMFTWSAPVAPINGQYFTSTIEGQFLHDIGVTKYAGLGYGISPSSQASIYAAMTSAQHLGIKQCYLNQSVPFGAVDFTAAVLAIKSKSCNGVTGSFVDNSDIALCQSVKQGGVTAKQLYFTGYDEDVLSTAANKQAFDGCYAQAQISYTPPNGPTQAMLNTLKKYDSSYHGGIPDFGLQGAYISTDLAIKGLQLTAPDFSRSSYISHLRQLKSYNAGGIMPSPVTMQGFATEAMYPKTGCLYFFQLQHDHYVMYSGKPICGTRIPYHIPGH